MADEVIKDIKIRYSISGLNQITRRVRMFDKANHQMITDVQKFDRTRGVWLTHSRNIQAMNTSASRLSTNVRGLATRFVGLQAAMMLAHRAGSRLIDWVRNSIQEFRKYEKNIAEVSTIISDMAKGDVPRLSIGIENLSVKFGKSANDLARSTYDILSAAFDASEALTLLETSSEAAVAGLTDVNTSVDVFTSILNAWGLSVAQAGHISDELFQTVVRGKLRFEDLASAMGYIAPIAANLGVEFKEVAAALSTVTRQGQHVDMATRGLALGIQNIADIMPKAADAALKYGVDLSATALRVGGLKTIIEDLHQATEEYGTKILPEMISNMRSLRVFMALVGDEGIKGFTRDLELLNQSTGKTEEAMTKMMQTSQFRADVLSQQMKKLERSIGGAWSEFDIWWKKTQLWFGTWLSGGDAEKAMSTFEQRIREIKIQSAELMGIQAEMLKTENLTNIFKEFDIESFKNIDLATEALSKLVSETVNFEAIKSYFDVKSEIRNTAELVGLLNEQSLSLESIEAQYLNLVDTYGKGKIPVGEINKLMNQLLASGLGVLDIQRQISKGTSVTGFLDFLTAIPKTLLAMSDKPIEDALYLPAGEVSTKIKQINKAIEAYTEKVEFLQEKLSLYEDSETGLRSTIDETTKSIETHKTNIMELSYEIKNLARDTEDTYKTIGGVDTARIFSGIDEWKIAYTTAASQLDRFTKMASMTIKFNDALDTSLMDNIKNIEGYGDAFKNINEYMNWYNDDIWEIVKQNHPEYEGSIKDLIIALGNYKEMEEELNIEHEKTKKELDELALAMKRNNLEIMKIELAGMMRRRGLTRSEEKMIKQIQIKNMELRIKMMEKETALEEEQLKKNTSDTESEYDKLKSIYDEYVERVQYDLWLLKDTRDSDLEDLIENLNFKRERLQKYRTWHQQEHEALYTDIINFTALMTAIDTSGLSEQYKKLYGLDVIEASKLALEDYTEFVKGFPTTSGKVSLPSSPTAPTRTTTISAPVTNRELTHKIITGQAITELKQLAQIKGFQRGIGYVPETRPYMLHRGEQIIPSGGEYGGGDIIIEIHNNNTVSSDVDVTKIATIQAEMIKSKIADKRTGKTKYRFR